MPQVRWKGTKAPLIRRSAMAHMREVGRLAPWAWLGLGLGLGLPLPLPLTLNLTLTLTTMERFEYDLLSE